MLSRIEFEWWKKIWKNWEKELIEVKEKVENLISNLKVEFDDLERFAGRLPEKISCFIVLPNLINKSPTGRSVGKDIILFGSYEPKNDIGILIHEICHSLQLQHNVLSVVNEAVAYAFEKRDRISPSEVSEIINTKAKRENVELKINVRPEWLDFLKEPAGLGKLTLALIKESLSK